MDESELRELFEASEVRLDSARLDAAWAAIDTSGLRRAARRLLGPGAFESDARAARRKGWAWAEARLRRHKALPAAFGANPAQHFYALQHSLTERRRKQWREAADHDSCGEALAA